MAVYTSLSLAQLKQILNQYELGEITNYEGISNGIENTNYYVHTTTGHYILTIFEHYKTEELPYFLQLMTFLRQHGANVPKPVLDSKQQTLTSWQSKPVALFNKLSGKSILSPDISHCQQIGTALAHLHMAGQEFPIHRDNDRGHHWAQQTGKMLLSLINNDDRQLLSDELQFQQVFNETMSQTLPQGVIHADLFCDNMLFENNQLSGILDFYTACHDSFLYDLAITVNACCLDNAPGKEQYLDSGKARAMIKAYEQIRLLNKEERQHWSTMLRAAGLRFWLSRLIYRQSRHETELTQDKDPDVLKYLLLKHRENTSFCQSLCLNHA